MGLSAPRGDVFQSTSWTETRTYRDGSIQQDPLKYRTDLRSTHNRSNPVSSPIAMISGVPWRSATSYSRNVSTWRVIPGSTSGTAGSGSRQYNWVQSGFRHGALFNTFEQVNHPDYGPGISDTDEHRKAITECLIKLQQQKVQLGTFLAEAKKSAEMLTDTSVQLLRLLRSIRHGRIDLLPKGFKGFKDTVGNGYLQWKYGWRPLCSDLYAMHQDLTTAAPRGAFVTAERHITTPVDFQFIRNGQPAHIKARVRDSCKLTGGITEQFLHDATSYGLTNPLSIAWELVPYSFVFDWFMPIGNTLQALSAASGLRFIGGYHSQVKEGTVKVDMPVGSVERSFFYFSRAKYTSFPRAQVYAERSPFRPSNLTSLVALINQLKR